MNKTISFIVFMIVAVAVISGGVWYENSLSAESRQAAITTNQSTPASGTTSTSTATATQTQTMDNLKITDIIVGTGAEAQDGDTVSVLYTGSLDNGTVFDASSKHGNTPFSFLLGAGQVIQGWDLGVVGMKIGGTRELVIPPSLGYGAQGAAGVIPPNATLHFTVQLLGVSSTVQ